MASLTNQLDTINTGKPIIEPSAPAPSFLSGLAKFGSGAMDAISTNYDESQKIGSTKALNTLAKGNQQLLESATATARASPYDGIPPGTGSADDPTVPEDVRAEALKVSKIKGAVDQGRAASTAYELGLENLVSRVGAQYPDQYATIAKYMNAMGLDHYTNREVQLQEEIKSAQGTAVAAGRALTIKHAIDSGYGQSGMNDEQLFSVGQDLQKAEYLQKLHKDQLDQLVTEQNLAKSKNELTDHSDKKADELAYSAGSAYLRAHMGGLLSHVQNLMSEAGNDDEAWNQIQATQTNTLSAVGEIKRRYLQGLASQGVGKDTIATLEKEADDQIKDFTDVYYGDKSRFAATQRSFQQVQNQLGISSEKALPAYAAMKRMFGPGAMDVIFDGNTVNALSPELKAKLKADFLRYDPTRPNEGFNIIQEIGALAQGNANLKDIPEGRVTTDYIKGIRAGVEGSRNRILDPGPDNVEDHKAFLGGYSNLVVASSRLQPGYKNVDGLASATDTLVNSKNVALLDREMKDPAFKGQATQVFLGTRASVAQLLEVSRTAGSSGTQKIVVQNGHFEVQYPKTSGVPYTYSGAPGFVVGTGPQGGPDPQLVKLRDTMNRQVDFLINTAAADSRTSGVDPVALRAHYVSGTPLPVKEGETAPKAPSFKQDLEAFNKEIHGTLVDEQVNHKFQKFNANKQIYQPMATEAAVKYHVPASFFHTLIGDIESQWNPNADAHVNFPESHAGGLGQVQPGTMEMYGYKGDDRWDPQKNLDVAAHYLSDLAKKHGGDWLAAAKEYSGRSYTKEHYSLLTKALLG